MYSWKNKIKMIQKKGASVCFVIIFIVSCLGCSSNAALLGGQSEPKTVIEYKYAEVGKQPQVPPGIVRMCWDEPKVAYEKSTPGLDVEGKWYHPYYVTVKEVKSGKWRPCSQAEFEHAAGKP